jgi:hypothetical protein
MGVLKNYSVFNSVTVGTQIIEFIGIVGENTVIPPYPLIQYLQFQLFAVCHGPKKKIGKLKNKWFIIFKMCAK